MSSLLAGSDALRVWLFTNRITHAQFGERIGRAGATVTKYAHGVVPPSDMQDAIEYETGGAVSVSLWSEQLANQVEIGKAHALLSRLRWETR